MILGVFFSNFFINISIIDSVDGKRDVWDKKVRVCHEK